MRKNIKKLRPNIRIGVSDIEQQQGFTLLELMISLVVGLVLFAGVLSIFVGMKTTVKETSNYGELQENARFALSVLTDDLVQQSFWGDYTGTINTSNLIAVPNAAGTECIGGGANNGTYPNANGHFRTIWGETSSATGVVQMSCISDAAPLSDVLQLKRVRSTPVTVSNPLTATQIANLSGFSYFVANTDEGAIYKVPLAGAAPVIKNSQTWEYQHHIYYVQANDPVLMKWRLTTQMINEPIVDGIEKIYFMYGVSSVIDPSLPGYGVVNAYVSAANMTPALWDKTLTNILAVKIYVLARSLQPDNKYTNTNTYQLGDFNYDPVDDNYRRLLLSSTVTLFNSEMDVW